MGERIVLGGIAVLSLALAMACGGGGSNPTSPSPSPSPAPTPAPAPAPAPSPGPAPAPSPSPGGGLTITITNNGASPRSLTVSAGSRVTFVNNATSPRTMNSDPHPEHTDCPEINQVGFLTAGQSGTTGNLNTRRTCGFHDHNRPSDTALQGTITIQ